MPKKQSGSNFQDIKLQNRTLVLRLIATNTANSRVALANTTGLSKMAIGNIVSELISQDMIEEKQLTPDSSSASGRPPIILEISDKSPRICGMLIKRGFCQVIISDLSGKIIRASASHYTPGEMNAEILVKTLHDLYIKVTLPYNDKIIAIGISSLGPINIITGEILNPPDFYNITNLNIVNIFEEITNLPVFLINDANAGALAEKLYGKYKHSSSFMYLHIMNGIGSGLVLEDKLFNGNFGQSGEIGHTSISFCGPKCSCGNNGCLDLYANISKMNEKAKKLSAIYPYSPILKKESPIWEDLLENANNKDPLSIAVLDEFCEYVSEALINALNLLDLSMVIVGYNAPDNCTIIEDILSSHIASLKAYSRYRDVDFVHSTFAGNAPLIGSIAVVADKIFNYQLDFN